MRIVEVRRDSGHAREVDIADFERGIDVRLPHVYRNFLMAHDAPRLQCPDFDFIDRCSGALTSRDVAFKGFGSALPRCNRIVDGQDSDGRWPDHVIVFGDCANGDYVCFDYRRDPATDEPAIAVLHHDYPDHDGKMLVSPVANSFDEFLGLLYRGTP